MARRTYFISFDSSDPTVDLDALKEFIKTDPVFRGWWNHIPFVFLVTSDEDAAAISEKLKPYTKTAKLLVMETNPAESEGWLPERSWSWIRRRDQRSPSRLPNPA